MRVGVYLPQNEIGVDLGAVTAFSQAAKELGYDHIMAFDHVILSHPDGHDGKAPARVSYTTVDTFSEVFVLFGCLAAVTKRVELAAGVLVLPQRQTVLAARQAAAVDVLSGGRLRLGVGVGWNEMEYRALGVPWAQRGARLEEQVELMRAFWTGDVVTFKGRWHEVQSAGIYPPPVRRPIPIWFGGAAKPMLERGGRMGDGFLLLSGPDETGIAQMETIKAAARAAGRDVGKFGFDVRIHLGGARRGERQQARSYDACAAELAKWASLGATHATFNTRNAQLDSMDKHIEALRQFKKSIASSS